MDTLKFKQAITEQAKEFLKSVDGCVGVISDSDADGVSAATIMTKALERKNISFHLSFLVRSRDKVPELLKSKDYKVWLFMDFGGNEVVDYATKYPDKKFFVLDHHKAKKVDLENVSYVNLEEYGIDGSYDVCGASLAYLFAVELDKINEDLSYIAIVGMVGDSQRKDEKFSNLNNEIFERANALGLAEERKGIKFYGWNSRPLHKALEYSVDPFFPGISGSESAAIQFLQEVGFELKKEDGSWKKFLDLNEDEKKKLASALILKRQGEVDAGNIFGIKIFFPKFPIEDLQEAEVFSSWTNSLGKQEHFSIAVATMLGDLKAYEDGKQFADEYKKKLMQALTLFYDNRKNEDLVIETENAIYFIGKNRIDPNITSTISTILSHSLPDSGKALFVTAHADNKLKISGRIINTNTKDIDLSKITNTLAEKLGGNGGGHKPAAGALVPKNKEDELIKTIEESFINS